MVVDIENSFELVTKEEWRKYYLENEKFNDLRIDASAFCINEDSFPLQRQHIPEIIFEHNNKVSSLEVTYTLCRHYYDKGIPDDPWYISPGNNGETIQYMPNFSAEHWGRQYWFNYFTNTFYFLISALWDSVLEIIKNYYGYEYEPGLNFRNKILQELKKDKPEIRQVFDDLKKCTAYVMARKYRTAVAHGTPGGVVQNTVKVIPSESAAVYGAGEYTAAATFMKNMEEYSQLAGEKIQDIVGYMVVDK